MLTDFYLNKITHKHKALVVCTKKTTKKRYNVYKLIILQYRVSSKKLNEKYRVGCRCIHSYANHAQHRTDCLSSADVKFHRSTLELSERLLQRRSYANVPTIPSPYFRHSLLVPLLHYETKVKTKTIF